MVKQQPFAAAVAPHHPPSTGANRLYLDFNGVVGAENGAVGFHRAEVVELTLTVGVLTGVVVGVIGLALAVTTTFMRANSVIANSPLSTLPASEAAKHALSMQGQPAVATNTASQPALTTPKEARQQRLPAAATTPAPVPATGVERSLQINIDSEDDAKAVIQHLRAIKAAYTLLSATNGITSIEFAINENIARKVEGTLFGAIPWTRTYTKHVKPFDGNVLFPLPHYQHPLNEEQKQAIIRNHLRATTPTPASASVPAPATAPQTPGNNKRPVPATSVAS